MSSRNTFRVPDEAALQAAVEAVAAASPKPIRRRVSSILGTKEEPQSPTSGTSTPEASASPQVLRSNNNTNDTETAQKPSEPTVVAAAEPAEPTTVINEQPVAATSDKETRSTEQEAQDKITSVLLEQVSSAISSSAAEPQPDALLTLSKANTVIDQIIASADIALNETDAESINDLLAEVNNLAVEGNKTAPIALVNGNISELIDSILETNSPHPSAPPPSPAVHPLQSKQDAKPVVNWLEEEETY